MKRCGCFARRRRLLRIVRNSLWLPLTRYATPPFPQKSRSARLLGCKRPPDGSLSLPTFADLRTAARAVPTGVQTELHAEPSLPLTRKVARRRRDGRREAINIKFSLSLPQSFFIRKMTAPSSEGAYVCAKFSICYKLKAIINMQIFSAEQILPNSGTLLSASQTFPLSGESLPLFFVRTFVRTF